jgi:hypothetical protein
MVDELAAVRARLAERNIHLTRRQLLRALATTGLGVAGVGRLLDAPDARAAYPTLRALLAAVPPAAEAEAPIGGHGQPLRGDTLPAQNRTAEGRFGLLFKHAPPYAPPDGLLSALARQMGDPGDAGLDNPGHPAGFTFFGQFVDHDITLDRTPLADAQADPAGVANFRGARYDLDSVYGGGPAASPQLYDPTDPDKLLVAGAGTPAAPWDLPRGADGRAVLAEGRNDENVITAQLHVAFLKFHNALVDLVRERGTPPDQVFAATQELVRWHYQWVVTHDFLPRLIGPTLMGELLQEQPGQPAKPRVKYYKPSKADRPMLPVEFTVAAYRFGHSTIRPGYTLNGGGTKAVFGPVASDGNLNGGRALTPALAIDWAHLFETDPGQQPQPSRAIDTRLALPLHHLPAPIVRAPDPIVSLAERNLLRGKRLGLPSGQEVARQLQLPPLTNAQLGLSDDPGWGGEAPLWYYILKEAELQAGGARLGAVGGRLVGEVLIGLLEKDATGYLAKQADFRPQPPIAPAPGRFALADLLRFAGVTAIPMPAPLPGFPDVPTGHPAAEAIGQLAARGVVRGYADGRFGPEDPILRAQMAALIVRAQGWGASAPASSFPDREGVDDELWRAVAALAARGVARGYSDGTYRPTAPVLNAQVVSFVARARVADGAWTSAPGDDGSYPNVPADSGHRADLVTYVHHAGALPDFPDRGAAFSAWDAPATRAWFARVLWQALDGSRAR